MFNGLLPKFESSMLNDQKAGCSYLSDRFMDHAFFSKRGNLWLKDPKEITGVDIITMGSS
jgi:hypothetical protein